MAKKEIKKDKIPGTSLQGMDALSPGGDLQAYINSVHSIGVLTREEEKKLAEDLYYRNDLDAARKLVLAHLRFVIYIAKNYSGQPKLISMKSGCIRSASILAASPMLSGLEPNICMPMGRCSSVKSTVSQRRGSPRTRASA